MSDTEEEDNCQSEDEEYEYEEDGGDGEDEEYEYEGDDGKRPATPQDDGPSGSVGSGGKASLSAIPDGQALMRSVSGAPVLARMVSYQVSSAALFRQGGVDWWAAGSRKARAGMDERASALPSYELLTTHSIPSLRPPRSPRPVPR